MDQQFALLTLGDIAAGADGFSLRIVTGGHTAVPSSPDGPRAGMGNNMLVFTHILVPIFSLTLPYNYI